MKEIHKNTGERLGEFVINTRRNQLFTIIIYAAFALTTLVICVVVLPATINEPHLIWRAGGGALVFLFFLFLTYSGYQEYKELGKDTQRPTLLTHQVRLLKQRQFYDSEDLTNYFEFEFEKGISVMVDANEFKATLEEGKLYKLRILKESGLVFDIKTLDNELIEEKVRTISSITKNRS